MKTAEISRIVGSMSSQLVGKASPQGPPTPDSIGMAMLVNHAPAIVKLLDACELFCTACCPEDDLAARRAILVAMDAVRAVKP